MLFAHFDQNHSKISVKRTPDVSFVATASCIVKTNKQAAFQCGLHPYVCGTYVSLSFLSVCNVISQVLQKHAEWRGCEEMLIKSRTTLQIGSTQQGFSYGFVLPFYQEKLDCTMTNGVCITNRKIPAWCCEAVTKGN